MLDAVGFMGIQARVAWQPCWDNPRERGAHAAANQDGLDSGHGVALAGGIPNELSADSDSSPIGKAIDA